MLGAKMGFGPKRTTWLRTLQDPRVSRLREEGKLNAYLNYNTGVNQMITVSVLYPNESGKKFDMDYYCNEHIPMVQQKLGSACKRVAVEHGVAGATPGAPPAFIAVGRLYFDSAEAFQTAFGSHAEAIMGDIPNYTDIQPTIQISEVKI
jgi:uncharacterized protein (TIGR02118 family)